MKIPIKKMNYRKSGFVFLVLFLTASIFFDNPAKAQEMLVAKLSDSELSAVLPVLKAEAAGYTKFMNAFATAQDRSYQLFLDIKSGKTDPLDWLKKYSQHIIVPPGAKYLPACSREVSIKSKELFKDSELVIKPSAVPTAVFTFGKDFPAINKQLLGESITNETYNKCMENPYNATDPSVDKLRLFIKDVNSFYTNSGFSVDYSPWEFLPVATAFSFYHREDEEHISGFINIFDFTLLDPAYPDVVEQCKPHVMGPVIEIYAEYKLLDEILSSPDISKSTDENTRNSLKKAGITEDRYALVKASLIMARRDSEFPDGIEVPSFEFTPTTDEERELAKIIETMKENALARKANIAVYNRYRAELDPILDNFEQQMYVP
ncbi:MAG: hypothetical protein A2V50_04145 [Bacteroidetes bacterium RBG_19FT_COMBO_42_10]|nr:MAG: hypothetical protein A2V50_04145 [Bacteroidetes bacterium RBG_19FT_COMBO_42_10]